MARKQQKQTDPFDFGATKFANDKVLAFLTAGLRGVADKSQEEIHVDKLRHECRKGNPFPLAAAHWPEMVLTDPLEIEIFQENLNRPGRFEGLPDRLKEVCTNPKNPPLRLDWWQYLLIASFFDIGISEIYVKGCTGAGKGGSTSIAINLWFDAFNPSRTTLTSETWEHATRNIYGEVCEWRGKMKFPQEARMLTETIDDGKRHYIVVRNPATSGNDSDNKKGGESFSGQHGPNTLYVFDEATAVADILFENCEKNASKIVALANPRTLYGRFRKAFEPMATGIDSIGMCYGNIGMRLCMTVGGLDCLNVDQKRLRRPVGPKQGIVIRGHSFEAGQLIPDELYQDVKPLIPNQIDLNLFQNNCARPDIREVAIYAHGKFPDEDRTKQVVLPSWLHRHEQEWINLSGSVPVEAFGLDVAMSLDGDNSVLSYGGKVGVKGFHKFKKSNSIGIVEEVMRFALEVLGINLKTRRHPVCIDMGGGYGSGVSSELKQRGVWVMEFQPSGAPLSFPRYYTNRRTESYGTLARRLDPADQFGATPFALPPDENLRAGLVAPEKKVTSDAIRFGIEPKKKIKEKLHGRSPDEADSVCYMFEAVRVINMYDSVMEQMTREILMWPLPANDKQKEAVSKPLIKEKEELKSALHDLKLDLGLTNGDSPAATPAKPDRYSALHDFYRNQYGND